MSWSRFSEAGRMRPGCLLLVVAGMVVLTGCTPVTPSSTIALERRDDRYFLIGPRCGSAGVEKISLGSGADLEGDFQVELQPPDDKMGSGGLEYEITGLVPPFENRRHDLQFPIHVRIEFDDGAADSFFDKPPAPSAVRYQEERESGGFVEVESSRGAFMEAAEAVCSSNLGDE